MLMMQMNVNMGTEVIGVRALGRGGDWKTRRDNLTNAYLSHANWHAQPKKGLHLIN